MRVTQVTLFGYATQVKLGVVVADDDEHDEEIKAFFAATPAASFEATIKNELAAEQFQPQQEFYVHLVPIQKK